MIRQVLGTHEDKDPVMVKYLGKVQTLLKNLDYTIEKVPRQANALADHLAKLVVLSKPNYTFVEFKSVSSVDDTKVVAVLTSSNQPDWMTPLIDCLQGDVYKIKPEQSSKEVDDYRRDFG